MISLKRGIVELVPYTAEWRRLFEEEKARLQAAIGQYVLDVQHVGSTAIPGLIAKPIIDIGIAVRDFEEARVCIGPIGQLGYEYRGEQRIPRRHYFVKGDPRTHHIHMNEIGSRDWEDQVLFRDYLIRHPELAEEYAGLKKELARQYPTDREAYLDGKAAFIERVLKMVRANKDSEAGVLPTEEQLAEMGKYNEELVKAGVLLAAEGLHASSKGARVKFSGAKRTVTDGPFAEAKELIAGFWLIQAKAKDEAIEWAKRVPFEDGEIEIRPVFELSDFAPSEAVEHHARLRDQIAKK